MNIKKELIALAKNIFTSFQKVYSENELKISSKEVGGKVEFILPDGELAPVEDGEYEMVDGFAFTVKDGMIESIKGQEQPEVQTTDEMVSVETSTEMVEVEIEPSEETPIEEPVKEEDSRLIELESKVMELEIKLGELMDMMKGQSESQASEMVKQTEAIQNFNKVVKELNEKITVLAKVPVEFSKTNTTQSAVESKAEKLGVLAGLMKK